MKYSIVVLLSFAVVSCVSMTPLTQGGQLVRVQKSDPPSTCQEIGIISEGSTNLLRGGSPEENARNKARNAAAERGANYLRLEDFKTTGNGSSVTGTAFSCR